MAFSSFFDEFPELVDGEFRNIFILDNETYRISLQGIMGFWNYFAEIEIAIVVML
jgi:hypothetical protein